MKPIKILIIFSVIAIIICLIYFLYQSSTELESNPKIANSKVKDFTGIRHLDVYKHNIPPPSPAKDSSLEPVFKESFVSLGSSCLIHVITLSGKINSSSNAISSLPLLIFLHGKSYTANTWYDIGTLQTFARLGYQSVAFDLPPRFGKTRCQNPSPENFDNFVRLSTKTPLSTFKASKLDLYKNAIFLNDLVKLLLNNRQNTSSNITFEETTVSKVQDVVLISPSMSGKYSLPYVMLKEMGPNKNGADSAFGLDLINYPRANLNLTHTRPSLAYNLKGFVSIAPTGTEDFDFVDYKRLRLPTLISYGEADTMLGLDSLRYLEQIPTSVIVPLVNAGHACYIDQTVKWNQILYNFLLALY
ncbi:protein ABHD14A-like isoform X1 [Gordionus sp. m RMFG-2023]|uniref:protein ABHD14A-like isoform X1 n=1 Tax=Gordionus sp. m RMFG-2023 TaxID=3053472 RepID=UPI0031FCE036